MEKFIMNKNVIVDNKNKEIKITEKEKPMKKTKKNQKASKKMVDIEAEQKERFIMKYLLSDGQSKEKGPEKFYDVLRKLECLLSIKYVTLNLLEKVQNNLEFINFKNKDDIENGEEEVKRFRQIIVGGLKEEEENEEIKKQIEGVIQELGGQQKLKIVDTFTFSDPSVIGVIEFTTEASKIGFWKKMKGKEFV